MISGVNKSDGNEDTVRREERKDKAKIQQAMAKSLNMPIDQP